MFADLVRAHRHRMGLSQEELASKTGLSARSIRNLEAGRTSSPRPATVRLLADTFGIAGAERDAFCQSANQWATVASDGHQRRRPAQLPGDVTGFTGRDEQLTQLDRLLAKAAGPSTPVMIFAIAGTAGVGKTALAIHAGHRFRHLFPDGQLFIDLHGFTEAMAPVESTDALERLLRMLGVPGQEIPAGLDDRAAMWRSAIAGRRMLVLLDNAATEDQIEPLLPGAPESLVLITSRRRLSGVDAIKTVSLDMLPLSDAHTLFERSVGPDRLARQPAELLNELAELCGRLPLAIRISAARLRAHPNWQIADLLVRLRDQDERLAELADEGGSRNVTAAMDVSYRQLEPEPRRIYRLLAHHPGGDVDTYAAAALAARSLPTTRRLLDQVLDLHLLQEPIPGRYGFHDLVRAHAVGLSDGRGLEVESAMIRLADYYRHTAAVAMDIVHPYERHRRPRVPASNNTPHPDMSGSGKATVWLDRELLNLMAVARHAAAAQWPEYLWHLSATLYRHLHTRGHYSEAVTLYQLALRVARESADRIGEMDALIHLGHVHRRRGRYRLALEHLEPALEFAEQTGDRARTLAALHGLGQIHWAQSNYDLAHDEFQRELRMARLDGLRSDETDALIGLAHVFRVTCNYDKAHAHLSRAITVARLCGNQNAEVDALRGLAYVYRVRGRYDNARECFHRARSLAEDVGYHNGELSTSAGLADLCRIQGQYERAAGIYLRILEAARRGGYRPIEFEVLLGLGNLQYATGQLGAAVASHRQALGLVTDLGTPYDHARVDDSLAHAYQVLDQHDQAREHWERALRVLTSLGLDRTEFGEATVASIQVCLDRLNQPSEPSDLVLQTQSRHGTRTITHATRSPVAGRQGHATTRRTAR